MENLNKQQPIIYSQRIHAGKRTYFIDVKKTKSSEDYYIIITESRKLNQGKINKQKIFLYKEDFRKFINALTETVDYVETNLLNKMS